ncbi:MAG: hypothetical protein AAGC63_16940, partial [Propionicimonas sp.]
DGSHAYLVNPVTAAVIVVDSGTGEVRYSSEVTPTLTENQEGRFSVIATLADGRVVTADAAGLVVWDPGSLVRLARAAVPAGAVGAALAPDGGDGVISVGPEEIARVDLRSGTILWRRTVDHIGGYAAVTADPGADRLYAADTEGRVDEFRLASGEPTGRQLAATQGSLVVTRSGEELVLVGGAMAGFVGGGTTGFVHWRLDGGSAVSRLVAPNRIAIEGFDHPGELLPVIPLTWDAVEDPPTTVWDVAKASAADVPPGPYRAWVGAGSLLDFSIGSGWGFYDVARRERIELADDPAIGPKAEVTWIADAGPGDRAYLLGVDRIVPVDPATGAVAGPVLPHPADVGAGPLGWWLGATSTVSESRSGDRLVVTWWEDAELVSFTSVFDLTTGAELTRGLVGTKRTWVTASDEVVGFAEDRITVSALDTLEVRRTLPRPGGVPRTLAVSADGRTLLATTYDQRVWLYDLAAGTRLGDPLTSDVAGWFPAYLNPDGRSLVLNTSAGVVRWDLDPAHQVEAACRLAGRELTAAEWSTYLAGLGSQRAACG